MADLIPDVVKLKECQDSENLDEYDRLSEKVAALSYSRGIFNLKWHSWLPDTLKIFA